MSFFEFGDDDFSLPLQDELDADAIDFLHMVEPMIVNYKFEGVCNAVEVRQEALRMYECYRSGGDPRVEFPWTVGIVGGVFPTVQEEEVQEPPPVRRALEDSVALPIRRPVTLEAEEPVIDTSNNRALGKPTQLNFNNVLLTWTRCNVSLKDCTDMVYRFFARRLEMKEQRTALDGKRSDIGSFMMGCQEHHKDGGLHLHVFLHFDVRARIMNTLMVENLALPSVNGNMVLNISTEKKGRRSGGVKGGMEYIMKESGNNWDNIITWPDKGDVRRLFEAMTRNTTIVRMEFMAEVRKKNPDGTHADIDSIVRSGRYDDLLMRSKYTLDFARNVQAMLRDEPFGADLFETWYELWAPPVIGAPTGSVYSPHSVYDFLNAEEQTIMRWIRDNLHPKHKSNVHKQRQLWIVAPPNARKTSLISLLQFFFKYHTEEASMKEYFLPMYDDRDFMFFDDIQAPFAKPIGVCLKLWEGTTCVMNNKGSSTTMRRRIPCICSSNPHPLKDHPSDPEKKALFTGHVAEAVGVRFEIVTLKRPLIIAPFYVMDRSMVMSTISAELDKSLQIRHGLYDYASLGAFFE